MTPLDAQAIGVRVGEALGGVVVAVGGVSGGDVAEAYRCDLGDQGPDGRRVVFAKTHRDPPPGFFATEAASLRWLRESGAVRVPEVLAVADDLLVLQWVSVGSSGSDTNTEAAFGVELAMLHLTGASCFGREDRATTTSRALPNEPTDTWAAFFAEQRLMPLARLAADAQAVPAGNVARIESVAGRLDQLGVPVEPPARLHGDLWAGNRMVDLDGASWLIDPAAHGGHREFDLAMMELFGGFGPGCWVAYDDRFPLAEGWEARVPLHQLAPLITHAIKFGGSYVGAVDRALGAAERLG